MNRENLIRIVKSKIKSELSNEFSALREHTSLNNSQIIVEMLIDLMRTNVVRLEIENNSAGFYLEEPALLGCTVRETIIRLIKAEQVAG